MISLGVVYALEVGVGRPLMLISLGWGRTKEWFDKLHPTKQKEYLDAHPHSKFGKKPASSKPSRKTDSAKPISKEHEKIRARIDALRKALK